MDSYILSRRLCNVLSRIVIVFGAFLLEVSPLKRQVNIALYFLLSKRYFLGFISLFSCVLVVGGQSSSTSCIASSARAASYHQCGELGVVPLEDVEDDDYLSD
jgi:hypothetical protein